MLIFLQAQLAYLAMPKTGTTALQAALRPHAQVILTRDPRLIHLHAAAFERAGRVLLDTIGEREVETVCQIRQPLSWLESWWKYRSADDLADPGKSTASIGFETFCGEYLDGVDRPYFDFGRPLDFLGDGAGNVLVDQVFRYEEMDHFLRFLGRRLGAEIKPRRRNTSPARMGLLSDAMRRRLEDHFAPEMAIWESGTNRDGRSAVRRLGDKAVKMIPNPLG